MMERQVQHMVRLVDDLLDVSRISRGKIELRKERVELAAVVAQRRRDEPPAHRGSGPRTDRHAAAASPVYVDADPTRLAQVFCNLLNNAAKYTEPGRPHLADRRAAGRRGRSCGCGTPGIGIAAGHAARRSSRCSSQVDRLAGAVAGRAGHRPDAGASGWSRCTAARVEARSDGPGRGSEFVVRLPVVLSRGAADAGGGEPSDGRAPTSRRRILVVDDNRDAADSLAMLLELMGNEVRTAHDGLEAVRGGGGVPARRGAAGHRPAEAERLRGLPPHPGAAVGQGHGASSP